MYQEMGSAVDSIKLVTSVISVVILLVNALIATALTLMWRTFNVFRGEIKEALRDYISRGEMGKMTTQNEIENLMRDCHECEIAIAKMSQQIEMCQKRCEEWRNRCDDGR